MSHNVSPSPTPPNNRKIAFVLAGILVILFGTAAVVWAVNRGGAESVQDVADAAVEAGEDIDVDAGIDLLCDAPTDEQREKVEEFVDAGKDEAGTDDPEIHVEASDVEGEAEGSFVLTIWSDDGGLAESYGVVDVEVEKDGDRSCIADVDIDQRDGPRP
ncbi:hypothetical protein [Nocardioides sp. Root151]|uniref:hypothetical protein n=1 Tax=Nocardioides sp. Root151 TaxID=1736475 RepID=UPI0007023D77|nr:hypothetical protein [Nocardioides sp. Root151]KQZ70198.1 hypothetical protein ASD66_11140 [Nocardioides sp. Root151]